MTRLSRREELAGSTARDGMSVEAHTGDVFGCSGPNGAGETNAVAQILGPGRPGRGHHPGRRPGRGGPSPADPSVVQFPAQTAAPVAGLTAKPPIRLVGPIRGTDRAFARPGSSSVGLLTERSIAVARSDSEEDKRARALDLILEDVRLRVPALVFPDLFGWLRRSAARHRRTAQG